ncbi:MAG: hypothetical protein ABI390_00235 [Daejeonella sp.]
MKKENDTPLYWMLIFTCLSFLTGNFAAAEELQPAVSKIDLTTSDQPQIIDLKVKKLDTSAVNSTRKNNLVYVNNLLLVRITNPRQFLLLRPSDNSKLILYADGLPLEGIYSRRFDKFSRQEVNEGKIYIPDEMWIPFVMSRDSESQMAWKDLYRQTTHWYNNNITFQASIGWEGMYPIRQRDAKVDTTITVVFYNPLIFWIWLIFFVLFVVFFIYLSATTDIICEYCKEGKGAYSLSQTQLVFWTVIVVGAFIYSLILTDLTDSLNTSVLMLLGISISTTGVASFIDYYKKTKPEWVVPKKHRSFLFDILSDGDNISVQRTQTAMWNIVFGIYFVIYTINNKTMPYFSETLLVLSGVSSSFYLGSKLVENVTPLQERQPPKISKPKLEPSSEAVG